MDYDSSWCPVCDRQIDPKRYQVPVVPPAPPPPPSSPQSDSPKNDSPATARRSKNATNRTKGGLVHGTGRVKPNGAIKRVDSPTKQSGATPPSPKPPLHVKHRTVIDQGPIPLYCSDECKRADLNYIHGALSLHYDPARSSPPLPPVPHNSFTGLGANELESDSSGSSVESRSSISSSSTPMSPSFATLAKMYNFPPPPPPAPVTVSDKDCGDAYYPTEYHSGVMMAGRLLKETLCPERPKPNIYGQCPVEPRKPIPGWTDGSTAWRSAVYNFSAPSDLASTDPTQKAKAYQSFSASPHRSRGVYSTLGEGILASSTPRTGNSAPSRATEAEESYAKYSLPFSRRSDSRTSIPTSPSSQSFPRRERSLLKPGAEGKLLVPDVKMRVHSGSSTSLSGAGSWTASSYPLSSRPSVKSPLSYHSHRSDDDVDVGDISTSLSARKKRPAVEERSWSYDNLKTYPVMQLPLKKEKRIEKQVVDGNEVEVEVEVEIFRPMKRLFLFPGKETSLERR